MQLDLGVARTSPARCRMLCTLCRRAARLAIATLLLSAALACGDDDSSPPQDGGASDAGADDGSTRLDAAVGCGDGERQVSEACDDGNTEGGDGCSADCREVEPHYDCTRAGVCVPLCGNSKFDPTEGCDDGNREGDDGCNADCEVEEGWGCARPGSACVELPVCGNSVRERGETCDSGPVSDPGCSECEIQAGYWCSTPGSPCVEERCGNGVRTPGEECDDDNDDDGDGCDDACTIEPGYRCSSTGCRPICGDGMLRGGETCDDGDATSGDGCSAGCGVEPGASCPTPGEACGTAQCGDGQPEGSEGCDDGNVIGGDGCGPTCQLEPQVTVGTDPVVQTRCGDGLVTSGEACDDGNAASGDGCSSSCAIEPGFACDELLDEPDSVRMKVTYRDFKGRDEAGGHPHMRKHQTAPPATGLDLGITGDVCDTVNQDMCGRLDAQGKPQLVGDHGTVSVGTANYREAFTLWYRDGNPSNLAGANGAIEVGASPAPVPSDGDFIDLAREGTTAAYRFDSASFYPLNGRGFLNTPNQSNNYHFTTELRSFFQYRGGETLTFRGDDDVWVFINGRLAVDIGGIHGPEYGRVVLGDDGPGGEDSTCTVSGGAAEPASCARSAGEEADATDTRFGLTKGNVYEIVLFHAERHPTGSNFRLTLSGFLAPRSYCTPICGDGIVAGWEACDDGADNADGVYGVCDTTCSAVEYCGDGVRQADHEACDNGFNLDLLYTSGDSGACAPGCVRPPACGDGEVQEPYELCDEGEQNDDDAYEGCTTRCEWGPYCGDGRVDPGEDCDDGAGNVAIDEAGRCGYDCKPAFILL